jgi:hypothetical protein
MMHFFANNQHMMSISPVLSKACFSSVFSQSLLVATCCPVVTVMIASGKKTNWPAKSVIILMVGQMPPAILAFHHTFVLYHPPR